MTRRCLLGERGECRCSLLRLRLSPLRVCTIETGVERCSGGWAVATPFILLHRLNVRLLLQARCLFRPRHLPLMAHLQLSEHEASGPLAGYRLSAAEAVPSVHLPFLTSRLDG